MRFHAIFFFRHATQAAGCKCQQELFDQEPPAKLLLPAVRRTSKKAD